METCFDGPVDLFVDSGYPACLGYGGVVYPCGVASDPLLDEKASVDSPDLFDFNRGRGGL